MDMSDKSKEFAKCYIWHATLKKCHGHTNVKLPFLPQEDSFSLLSRFCTIPVYYYATETDSGLKGNKNK